MARFAARFADLGFSVHPSTVELMREITASGELEHLVPERSWNEIYRALGAVRPSVFLATLRVCGALKVLLPEVEALYGIPQPEKWHPEIDTGLHVEMALDFAASMKFEPKVLFAVLLHDLGKGLTDKASLPLRAEVANIDASLPIRSLQTMEDAIAFTLLPLVFPYQAK